MSKKKKRNASNAELKRKPVEYVQLPASVFVSLYPGVLPFTLLALVNSDPNYVVRFNRAAGLLELGYADDDWDLYK